MTCLLFWRSVNRCGVVSSGQAMTTRQGLPLLLDDLDLLDLVMPEGA